MRPQIEYKAEYNKYQIRATDFCRYSEEKWWAETIAIGLVFEMDSKRFEDFNKQVFGVVEENVSFL